MDRRSFLQSSSLLMATAAVSNLASASDAIRKGPMLDETRWPIMQGMTDAVSATFVILHPSNAPFQAQVVSPRRGLLPFTVLSQRPMPLTNWVLTEIATAGLIPNVDHKLQLIDGSGKVFDERLFRSLDPNRAVTRFALASCANDKYEDKSVTMWESLMRQNCDFLIIGGDSCYADNDNDPGGEVGLLKRYTETRSRLSWFRLPRLIPTVAAWDDHDYGVNNGDRTFRYKGAVQQIFRHFHSTKFNSMMRPGPGVSSMIECFGQRFYMMDNRSFRDPLGQKNGAHWGREQIEWLMNDLSRSPAPAWIVSGSQFFGGSVAKEAFSHAQPEELAVVMKAFSRINAPVVLCSGDVHFSEIMKLEPALMGYQSYEFTSSSIHSHTFPYSQHRGTNARRMVSEWRHNYMLFESDVRNGWKIRARCVTEGDRVLFANDLTVNRNA